MFTEMYLKPLLSSILFKEITRFAKNIRSISSIDELKDVINENIACNQVPDGDGRHGKPLVVRISNSSFSTGDLSVEFYDFRSMYLDNSTFIMMNGIYRKLAFDAKRNKFSPFRNTYNVPEELSPEDIQPICKEDIDMKTLVSIVPYIQPDNLSIYKP